MKIHLLAVGTRMPGWVTQGFEEYARRMPAECTLRLVEIAAVRRGRSSDARRAVKEEGERILAAVPPRCRLFALDAGGQQLSTESLARRLGTWLQDGRDVAMCIGGADGFAPGVLQRSELRLALSEMTLPHMLIRIVIAEQLYRAWSILNNHPYHRS